MGRYHGFCWHFRTVVHLVSFGIHFDDLSDQEPSHENRGANSNQAPTTGCEVTFAVDIERGNLLAVQIERVNKFSDCIHF